MIRLYPDPEIVCAYLRAVARILRAPVPGQWDLEFISPLDYATAKAMIREHGLGRPRGSWGRFIPPAASESGMLLGITSLIGGRTLVQLEAGELRSGSTMAPLCHLLGQNYRVAGEPDNRPRSTLHAKGLHAWTRYDYHHTDGWNDAYRMAAKGYTIDGEATEFRTDVATGHLVASGKVKADYQRDDPYHRLDLEVGAHNNRPALWLRIRQVTPE